MGCDTGTELISLCIMYVFAATTGPWFEIMDLCILCKTNTGEKLSKLTDVGLETLRTSCELRHCDEIGQLLDGELDCVFVHSSCRKSFTRTKDLKETEAAA